MSAIKRYVEDVADEFATFVTRMVGDGSGLGGHFDLFCYAFKCQANWLSPQLAGYVVQLARAHGYERDVAEAESLAQRIVWGREVASAR